MLQCQTGIAKYHIRNSEIYHYLWLGSFNGSSQILCIADTAFTKPNDFKLADTVLYISYLSVVVAICALIWSAIRNAVKK